MSSRPEFPTFFCSQIHWHPVLVTRKKKLLSLNREFKHVLFPFHFIAFSLICCVGVVLVCIGIPRSTIAGRSGWFIFSFSSWLLSVVWCMMWFFMILLLYVCLLIAFPFWLHMLLSSVCASDTSRMIHVINTRLGVLCVRMNQTLRDTRSAFVPSCGVVYEWVSKGIPPAWCKK